MDTFPLESTRQLGYTQERCVALQEYAWERFKQETH